MKNRSICVVISFLLFPFSVLKAQKAIEDFNITFPSKPAASSLYKTIKLVDVRYDQGNMGIVQLGAFNKKARVVPQTPFDVQLSNLFNYLNDNKATSGETVMLLRQLSFAEVTGAMSERGYFHFRAVLFAKAGDEYKTITSIDTVVLVRGMDVTKGLFREGSRTIADFLASGMAKEAQGNRTYTSNDVVNFDKIEKQGIALYSNAGFKNGIYRSFRSFADQTPDVNDLTVEFDKSGNVSAVKIKNEKDKLTKVSSKDMYAFVHDGHAFISTTYGYYPLTKTGDDLFFTGKASVAPNNTDVIVASVFFGVIGGLIASSPGSALFEMKIDHLSGGFIRLKEVTTGNANTGSE